MLDIIWRDWSEKVIDYSRSKRLIYENYRLKEQYLIKGYDFIFVARSKMKGQNYQAVSKSMDNLLKKAGLYEKDINKSN